MYTCLRQSYHEKCIFIGEEKCLRHILKHLQRLDHTWFYLGLSLGVPYDAVKNIESNEREVERRMMNMLARWMQDRHVHGSGVASWRSLAIAFDGCLVGKRKIAQQIKDKYSLP